jgi:hypothetical protein
MRLESFGFDPWLCIGEEEHEPRLTCTLNGHAILTRVLKVVQFYRITHLIAYKQKPTIPPHYAMTSSLNQGATGLQTEAITSSSSHILSKHPNAQLTQKRPTPTACFTHKQPPTIFALYQQLPIELQLQIIKQAWLNELSAFNQDIDMLCSYSMHLPEPQIQNCSMLSHVTRLPSLSLVNKQFLAESRFLAKPYLLTDVLIRKQRKRAPFIPDLDTLQLHIRKTRTHGKTILECLDKLPEHFRKNLKHLKLKGTKEEALILFHHQRAHRGVTRIILRMKTPLLETITILGMSPWSLISFDDADMAELKFSMQFPKRQGGIVKVEWANVQELGKWVDDMRRGYRDGLSAGRWARHMLEQRGFNVPRIKMVFRVIFALMAGC